MTDKLQGGDTLPDVSLQLVGGGTVNLPADVETPYAVALFYRGHW